MRFSRKFLVGLLVVSISLVTVAGISFAAEDSDTGTTTSAIVNGCRGFFGGAADELAKLLGLKSEEIVEKRNAGQSLADIAKARGVEKDKVVDAIVDSRERFLDEKVEAGYLTEEQKNQMLERMKSRVRERIEDPAVGPGGGRGGGGCGMGGPGGGPGMRGGRGPGAGFGDASAVTPTNL
ncbi:MAG: hypothetical protein KGZ93_00540 [Actinobacteria bacterium]|nr:hypothetical protein [Actinomycetota bacterium]